MGIFNQMIREGFDQGNTASVSTEKSLYKPRTFKETIQDQIVFHQAKVTELEAVRDSLTPEIEKFVEAIQKLG